MIIELRNMINDLLNSSVEESLSLAFTVNPKEMKLRNDYDYNEVMSDCSGWSGHCPCSNNPCMVCSSAH